MSKHRNFNILNFYIKILLPIVSYVVFLECILMSEGHLVQMAARTPIPGKKSAPGSPWPLPKVWSKNEMRATLAPAEKFRYSTNLQNCSVLNAAIERYNYALLTRSSGPEPAKGRKGLPILSTVYIQISPEWEINECSKHPHLSKEETYESYNLLIEEGVETNSAIGIIAATTVWGALRGLETFSQLIWRDLDWAVNKYYINYTEITDAPRYPHRGLMLDTARHYVAPNLLLEVLDAMSYNKFNVFHWHIVDDQSFPYVSQKFPELSEKGAFIPGYLVYDPPTVQRIIEEARLRGIRVILEFDTPGHTFAFGKSHPELLTPCYGDGVTPGTPNYPKHAAYENLDPTKETTYNFMREFFSEVYNNVTHDDYIHLGMDEIYYPCWESSPEIQAFMEQNGMTNIDQVQEHYTQRHLKTIKDIGAKAIVWQDPLEYGVPLEKDVIVQVWKSPFGGHALPWQEYLQMVLDKGYTALLSACWYVNYLKYGQTWREYYECDPVLNLPNITESQKSLILGGEAAIWGEYVDTTNLIARLFPYIGAVAEKLWSPIGASTTNDALWRLDEHRCRLLGRGIKAQPLITSYCFPEEANYSYSRPGYSPK